MVTVNGQINPHTQPSRSLTPQLSSKDRYGMFNRLCNCLNIIVDWRIKANLFLNCKENTGRYFFLSTPDTI